MWHKVLCLAILLVTSVAMVAQTPSDVWTLVDAAKANIVEVDVSQFQKMLKEDSQVVVIDIREDGEFKSGHLENAHHLSRGILEFRIAKLVEDRNAPLVLYCGGGNRSALSAESLQKMGYTKVYSLIGGMQAIQEAALPLIKPDQQ